MIFHIKNFAANGGLQGKYREGKQLFLKQIAPGSFMRSVVALMTGTTVAQAIPIAISPILTRLYTPEDFGVLALFTSIVSIFGAVADGRYELAIVLPVDDEDAINITALCIIVAAAMSVILLVVVLLFHPFIVEKLGNPEIGPWLYFAPLVIFLTGLFNALNYFHIRTKKFSSIARATVNRSIAAATVQLGLGFLKTGAFGLVLGQIVSSVTGNGTLGLPLLKDKRLTSAVNLVYIRKMAKRYIDFPKFSTWSILANTLVYNLVNIFISSFYGSAVLGLYSLGNRVLGTPMSLVGDAIGKVFFQKAAEERRRTGRAIAVFLKTFKTLLVISLPPFLFMFFFIEDLFALVFGEEWRIAGEYAKIMLPLFFVRFVMAPLSTINSVFEKQKISLVWQLCLLITFLGVIAISSFSGFHEKVFFRIFSFLSILMYVALFYLMIHISQGK